MEKDDDGDGNEEEEEENEEELPHKDTVGFYLVQKSN